MSDPHECPECDGAGRWLDIDGNTVTCERCDGDGVIYDDEEDDESDD